MSNLFKNGYVILNNFIDSDEVDKYWLHCKKLGNHINAKFDNQTVKAKSFYADTIIEELAVKLQPTIEKLIGKELYPTVTYWRLYKKGSILEPHKDRPTCEISITLHIGREDKSSWDLFIKDNEDKTITIKQNAGDALIYLGCKNLHWRKKFEGNDYAQVFLHYVLKHGDYAAYKYDFRGKMNCVIN